MNDPKLKPGTNYCLCRSCGQYFGGVKGFDMHRRDSGCLPPDTLLTRKGERLLEINARGYWVTRAPKSAFPVVAP